jgi:hypothetical protein
MYGSIERLVIGSQIWRMRMIEICSLGNGVRVLPPFLLSRRGASSSTTFEIGSAIVVGQEGRGVVEGKVSNSKVSPC